MMTIKTMTIKGKRSNGKEFTKSFEVKVRDDGYMWVQNFFGSTGYGLGRGTTISTYCGKVLATDVAIV